MHPTNAKSSNAHSFSIIIPVLNESNHIIEKISYLKKITKGYNAEIIIVAFGMSARIAQTIVKNMRNDGIKIGLFRPKTLWPFPSKELYELAKNAKRFLVLEQNFGQMLEDVKLAIECKRPVEFYGRAGGGIFTPKEVYEFIKEKILW